MEKNNSKQIVLSIIAVLVLVVAVVGVSFAMYQFASTGTKSASISTATLSLNFTGSVAKTLSNKYPSTDAKGYASSTEDLYSFAVTPNNPGNTTIRYRLWFETSGEVTGGLTADMIKYVLTDANGLALEGYGTCADTTKKTDAECDEVWTLAPKTISQNMTSATSFKEVVLNDNVADQYYIKAWVSDAYDFSTLAQPSASGETETGGSYSFTVKMTGTTAPSF